MTTTDRTTPATDLMRNLLEASVVYLARATTRYVASEPGDRDAADRFAANAMAAQYAGAAARLLHVLMAVEPDECRAVSSQLAEWLEFGEPLADWVAEQATAYGIDVDKL
ncbi:MAG TPA: hypothetical protein VGW74_13100, partial [Propionibacteriaceae bacterium]|nr:hypothetical protein [Propionibacteriaceae bacterium]